MIDDTKIVKPKPEVPGVDYTYNQYDLTTIFFDCFKYHNEDCMVTVDQLAFIKNPETGQMEENVLQTSLSRFAVMRRIYAGLLSSRPFMGNEGIAPQKPNISLGYLRLLLTYVALPFKTVMSEPEVVKLRFNRRLKEAITQTPREKEEQKLQARNNPNIYANQEISDDVGDAFNTLLSLSPGIRASATHIGDKMVIDAFVALLHSDLDWSTKPIEALDFVFEPQAHWNTEDWSYFFIIENMPAQAAVRHIKNETKFWNIEALKWALQNSVDGKGIFRDYKGGQSGSDPTPLCGENFMVKSLYRDKDRRNMSLASYYGNLLVVRAFYITAEGKVQETIFFPSSEFYNIHPKDRKDKLKPENLKASNLEGSDVLFTRETKFKSIKECLTIIPAKRSELTLERQRYYAHELFNVVEMLMRTDSAILNIISLMGVLFTKNRGEGSGPQNLQDLHIKMTGALQDLGDREFVDSPLTHDLNGMLAVRQMLWQHANAKSFLSGLDGAESQGEGRGGDLARWRLVRDGRVNKHDIKDLAQGTTEWMSKVLRAVLNECKKPEAIRDKMVSRLFYDQLMEVHGYSKELFKFDEDDILDETYLPYWLSVEPISNGASHMGPAEMVIYTELKQVTGDSLTKLQLDNLNRAIFKSVLNASDATDILGDPREQTIVDQDQLYAASLENAAILGSVDSSVLNFEAIGIKETKDDPITHLAQSHNPKAQEIIKMLDEGQVSPQELQEQTDQQLQTRINLILKLAALSNHISLHQQQLEFFGGARPDVNQLREETNSIIQSSEGLLNNLQVNLRAQQEKRDQMELRLRNLSPENEAEKMKQQNELMTLEAQKEYNRGRLMVANKIDETARQIHKDKQFTSARDRASKEKISEMANRSKDFDAQSKAVTRQAESNFSIQSKAAESSISQRVKLQEAGLNSALKTKQTQESIALKASESAAKIENQKRESEAAAKAKAKSNGVST